MINSFIAWFLVLFFAGPPMPQQNDLVVTVQGLKNDEGSVMVGLFDNDDDFLERPVAGKVASIVSGTAEVVFDNLKPGKYGISVIHDQNDNGKLDTNSIGIPKEGFAFGNNAMGMFGPPSFRKASITVGQGPVKQTLIMRYF